MNRVFTDSRHIVIKKPKDRQPRYQTLEQDIRLLSSELYRLIKLPYSSKANFSKIRSLEDQIMYLEQVIAATQAAQKELE